MRADPTSSPFHRETLANSVPRFAGFVPAFFMPDWFIAAQNVQPSPFISTDNSRLVAQQLGNCYGLLMLVGLAVLNTSTELPVVRNYLKALWVADITHMAVTCYALGYERSVSLGEWDAMLWGNVGVTVSPTSFWSYTRVRQAGASNTCIAFSVPDENGISFGVIWSRRACVISSDEEEGRLNSISMGFPLIVHGVFGAILSTGYLSGTVTTRHRRQTSDEEQLSDQLMSNLGI